jgi:hypothetical protein
LEASPGKQFHKTLSRKTLHKNRADRVAQGEGPEFKPQYSKKKKRKKINPNVSPYMWRIGSRIPFTHYHPTSQMPKSTYAKALI